MKKLVHDFFAEPDSWASQFSFNKVNIPKKYVEINKSKSMFFLIIRKYV